MVQYIIAIVRYILLLLLQLFVLIFTMWSQRAECFYVCSWFIF